MTSLERVVWHQPPVGEDWGITRIGNPRAQGRSIPGVGRADPVSERASLCQFWILQIIKLAKHVYFSVS